MCYSLGIFFLYLVGPYAKVHTLEWTNTRKKVIRGETYKD